jgi:ABC-type multidrug transport system permease subunit
MDNLTTTSEKVEARSADEVMSDMNATPQELVDTVMGESDEKVNEETNEEAYITTEDDFNNAFGLNTRDVEIALVVTAGVSFVIALVIFFAIAMKRKAPKSGFMRYLREFLNFRKIWVAGILKFVYIFSALALTIGSIVMMFFGGDRVLEFVLLGIFMIVFGNIFLRLGFEMTMMIIGIWENTRDIRGSLVKDEERPEPREKIIKKDDLMEMDEEETEVDE